MTTARPRPTTPPRPPGRPGATPVVGARAAHGPVVRHGVLGRGPVLDLVALVVLLAVAAVIAVLALTRGTEGVDMDTRDATFPATPPVEWSGEGVWRSPTLMPKSGRVLVVDEDRVAMLTASRKIVLVQASTGDTIWAAGVPDATVRTPLAATQVDGKDVVAAQFGDSLAWWGRDDAQPGRVDLPPGSTVTFHGTAPLARTKDGRTGAVTSTGLKAVTVPPGATVWAARTDGTVTATTAAGWWHLVPGRAPGRPRPWAMPGRSGSLDVVGYVGSSLVTTGDRRRPTIVVHADRLRDVRYLFEGRYVPSTEVGGAQWTASPSRTWGILGRSLVDLRTGTVQDLGAWRTLLVDEDRALGVIGDQSVVVGPEIPRGRTENKEGFPEAVVPTGALVRAKDGDGEAVYLLPPAEKP